MYMPRHRGPVELATATEPKLSAGKYVCFSTIRYTATGLAYSSYSKASRIIWIEERKVYNREAGHNDAKMSVRCPHLCDPVYFSLNSKAKRTKTANA